MAVLQLCRWQFSHKETFLADFIRLKLTFIQKTKKTLFETPFRGLKGNVHTSSMARWKARSHTVETL